MSVIERSFYKEDKVGNHEFFRGAFSDTIEAMDDNSKLSRKCPSIVPIAKILGKDFYTLGSSDSDVLFVTINDTGIFDENVIRNNNVVAGELCQFVGFCFNAFVESKILGEPGAQIDTSIKNIKVYVFSEKSGMLTNLASIDDFSESFEFVNGSPTTIRNYPEMMAINKRLESIDNDIGALKASGIDNESRYNKLDAEGRELSGKLAELYSNTSISFLNACAEIVDIENISDIFNISIVVDMYNDIKRKQTILLSYHDAYNASVKKIKNAFAL